MLWLARPDSSGHCLGQAGWLFLQETPCFEVFHLINKDAAISHLSRSSLIFSSSSSLSMPCFGVPF